MLCVGLYLSLYLFLFSILYILSVYSIISIMLISYVLLLSNNVYTCICTERTAMERVALLIVGRRLLDEWEGGLL